MFPLPGFILANEPLAKFLKDLFEAAEAFTLVGGLGWIGIGVLMIVANSRRHSVEFARELMQLGLWTLLASAVLFVIGPIAGVIIGLAIIGFLTFMVFGLLATIFGWGEGDQKPS